MSCLRGVRRLAGESRLERTSFCQGRFMTFGLSDCRIVAGGGDARRVIYAYPRGDAWQRGVQAVNVRTVPERRRRGEGDASSFPLPTSFCGVLPFDCGDEARFGDGELESVSRSAVSACDGRPAVESMRGAAQRSLLRPERTSAPGVGCSDGSAPSCGCSNGGVREDPVDDGLSPVNAAPSGGWRPGWTTRPIQRY